MYFHFIDPLDGKDIHNFVVLDTLQLVTYLASV